MFYATSFLKTCIKVKFSEKQVLPKTTAQSISNLTVYFAIPLHIAASPGWAVYQPGAAFFLFLWHIPVTIGRGTKKEKE